MSGSIECGDREQLLVALSAGQPGAETAFHNAYERFVKNLVFASTRGRQWTKEDREDLCQDAWKRILARAENGEYNVCKWCARKELTPMPYIALAVKHAVIDEARSRPPTSVEFVEGLHSGNPGNPEGEILKKLEAEERKHWIMTALPQCGATTEESEAFKLRLFKGLSYGAIAERLGRKSDDTAFSWVSRASKKLDRYSKRRGVSLYE